MKTNYKKLDQNKFGTEKFELNPYLRNMQLVEARQNFRIRSSMTRLMKWIFQVKRDTRENGTAQTSTPSATFGTAWHTSTCVRIWTMTTIWSDTSNKSYRREKLWQFELFSGPWTGCTSSWRWGCSLLFWAQFRAVVKFLIFIINLFVSVSNIYIICKW